MHVGPRLRPRAVDVDVGGLVLVRANDNFGGDRVPDGIIDGVESRRNVRSMATRFHAPEQQEAAKAALAAFQGYAQVMIAAQQRSRRQDWAPLRFVATCPTPPRID